MCNFLLLNEDKPSINQHKKDEKKMADGKKIQTECD